ncbi:MAG: ABC transporter substrate-binding protein [Coriobacteriia bacterium]
MTASRWAVLLCAVTAVLALVGCSATDETVTGGVGAAAGGPAFANVEPDEITIGIAAGGEALPLVVADRGGLFDEAGVTATITRFETAAERDAALAAGEIDAMVAELDSAVALEAAGTQVAVVSLMADPAGALESTSTPAVAQSPALFGLTGSRAYFVVSDFYLALPSGLLATRAALEASDIAVVSIQADPGAHLGVLGDIAPGDVTVAVGAYGPSAAPGEGAVGTELASLVAARPELSGVSTGDLILDIGR